MEKTIQSFAQFWRNSYHEDDYRLADPLECARVYFGIEVPPEKEEVKDSFTCEVLDRMFPGTHFEWGNVQTAVDAIASQLDIDDAVLMISCYVEHGMFSNSGRNT